MKSNYSKTLTYLAAILILTTIGTLLLTYHKSELPTPEITVSSLVAPTDLPTFISEASDNISKVNLNTATLEELTTLTGIGPKLAQRIIEYRSEKSFKTIYDLKKVTGIGDKKFEAIEAFISVSD